MLNKVNVERFCNTAVIACYCALIFFLPISIALVESFAGGVIFFYVVKKIASRDFKPHGSFLSAAMFANILVVLTSLFFSKFFVFSLFSFFAKFLEGCFLYYSFVECFERKRHFQFFMGALAASAVLICTSGLSQYLFHYEFVRGMPLDNERISSTFRNANDFGAYLIPMVTLTVAFLFHYVFSGGLRLGYKVVLGVLAVLPMVCLGMTYSRSSWLGFFGAIVLAGFVCRRLVQSVFLCVLFLAVFLPLMALQRNVSFISDDSKGDKARVQEIINSEQAGHKDTGSVWTKIVNDCRARAQLFTQQFCGMGRAGFWREAAHIIRKFPFFGTGLNTYSKIAPGYKLSWGGYPHNCYLQMAAEIGMIGLVSFFMLMGVLFVRAVKAIVPMRDAFLKSIAAGACAGLFGFLVQSGLDTTLYSVQLANLMWIIMGLIVAAIAVDGKQKSGI